MQKLKLLLIALFVTIGGFVGYNMVTGDNSSATTYATDCDANAIIRCGTLSTAALKQKYDANSTGDLHNIFNAYGISASMIASGAKTGGYVTKTGNVVYNGKTVATGANSLGRQYISGSSKVTIAGHAYYSRPTSVSFVADSIPAYIFFDGNGKFVAAILYSCGNPVKAVAVPVPPKPVYSCDSLTVSKITRTEYQFTAHATAKNGAIIKGYSFNFGDGTTNPSGLSATATHSYLQDGTFAVAASVQIQVDGKIISVAGNCKTTVTVVPAPCTIPGKENLPANSPLCVPDNPGVKIVKNVNHLRDITVKAGVPFEYELAVTNTGDVDLQFVKVTDPAPAGVQFVSTPVGIIGANSWSYTIPSLAKGETRNFTIMAKVVTDQTADIPNTACVDVPTIPGYPDSCDTVYVHVKKIQVCELATSKIITIDKSAFDSSKYSTDMNDCVSTPPVTPPELPHTGIGDVLGGTVSLGTVSGASLYYLSSRRQLMSAMFGR